METDAIENGSRAIWALNMPAADKFGLAQDRCADNGRVVRRVYWRNTFLLNLTS